MRFKKKSDISANIEIFSSEPPCERDLFSDGQIFQFDCNTSFGAPIVVNGIMYYHIYIYIYIYFFMKETLVPIEIAVL